MVTHVRTVALVGIEARPVDVQVQLSSGLPAFTLVGLPDKAVAESRERVRAALTGIGLALPPKRITVNLAPADLPKEGSHYDLPIALGLMAACGAIPADILSDYCVLGELALDGSITPVGGVLPAAIAASTEGLGLICPETCGSEAAWAGGDLRVLAPRDLIALSNHFKCVPRPCLICAISAARKAPSALSRSLQRVATISCSLAHRGPENPCWLSAYPRYYRPCRHASFWILR